MHFKEADSFSSSHYHILNPVVQRMGTPDDTEQVRGTVQC